jgi:hypothetical protein
MLEENVRGLLQGTNVKVSRDGTDTTDFDVVLMDKTYAEICSHFAKYKQPTQLQDQDSRYNWLISVKAGLDQPNTTLATIIELETWRTIMQHQEQYTFSEKQPPLSQFKILLIFNGCEPTSAHDVGVDQELARVLEEHGSSHLRGKGNVIGDQWAKALRWHVFTLCDFHLWVAGQKICSPKVQHYWVLLTEDATKPSNTPAFKVFPNVSDIDGLKDAVKEKMESNTGERVNALVMKVYAYNPATGGWEEVPKSSALLTSNSEETAYHVVVPTK